MDKVIENILEEWKSRVKQNIAGKASLALLEEILTKQLGESLADKFVKEANKWQPLHIKIARQQWDEYQEWLGEWDGDYPNEKEYASFPYYLDKMEERG